MNALERVLDGAVDMHVHSGPSPFPRRIDHAEAAQQADAAGLRAIVVKSHHHSTVMDVRAVRPWGFPNAKTQVFGGIALNNAVGGLNPAAVDLCLKMGGKVVWFPTIASPQHLRHSGQQITSTFPTATVRLMQEQPVDILQENGELRPEVEPIIDQIIEAGAVLNAGHLAADRILTLFEVARGRGATKLVVSHPNYVVDASREDVRRMADLGALVEHCLCMYDEAGVSYKGWGIDALIDWIELVGPDQTILGSDLGQRNNPLPVETFRKLSGRLLDAGVSEADVRKMVGGNQARLLDLA